jgi:hypothetical protein
MVCVCFYSTVLCCYVGTHSMIILVVLVIIVIQTDM